MSALLINETFLNTFLRTQKSGFALKSVFLSEFALLRAFLSAQKSTQGPTEPLCIFMYMHARVCVCMCVCVFVCMCQCVSLCLCMSVSVFLCV